MTTLSWEGSTVSARSTSWALPIFAAEAAGVKMESVGLAERAERIVFIGVASFVSYFWIDALNWSVLILAILTNFTVLQRANYFHKAAKTN